MPGTPSFYFLAVVGFTWLVALSFGFAGWLIGGVLLGDPWFWSGACAFGFGSAAFAWSAITAWRDYHLPEEKQE